jgi:hypothetical protein
LTRAQRLAFKRALAHFIDDTKQGKFRVSLPVKGVQGMSGCFEMTWAGDGRAIFTYGAEVLAGEHHVIWLAVGTHAVLP